MIVPVTIRGTDTFGQPFKENTWTIGINEHGARIATFHALASGCELWISNPVLGRTAKGRVIWLGEKRFPEDPYEVGVELLEAENVWGINFPPEDWKKGVTAGGPAGAGQIVSSADAVPGSPGAASPGNGESLETTQAEKAPAGSAGEPGSEKLSQFNLAVAALSHFAQQAEARTETPPASAPKVLDGAPTGSSAAAAVGAATAPSTQEPPASPPGREPSLTAGPPEPKGGQAVLREPARLSKETEGEKSGRSQLQLEKPEETSPPWFQSAVREMSGNLRQVMKDAFTKLTEETRRTLQEEARAEVRRLTQEASASLDAIVKERLSRTELSLSPALLGAASGAPGSVAAAELDLEMRKTAAQLASQLRASLEKTAEDSARGFEIRLGRSFEEQASAAEQRLTSARETLEITGQTLVQEARNSLSSILRSSTDSFTVESRTLLDGCRSELQKACQESVERARQDIEGQLHTASAKLAEAGNEQLQRRVETLTKEALSWVAAKTDEAVHQASDGLSKSGEQLQKRAEALVEEALGRARARSDEFVQQASDSVYKQVGVAAVVLKEWLDQTRGQLEGTFRSLTVGFQQQVEETCRTTLEKTRGQAEDLLQEVRERASQIGEISRTALEKTRVESGNLLQEIHARLEQAARALRAPTAPTPEPPTPPPSRNQG